MKSMKGVLTILLISLCSSVVAQDSLDTSSQRQKSYVRNVAINIGKSNVGLFGDVDTIHGIQLNGFTSVARNEMRGVQLSGLSNVAKNMRGVQIAGLGNITTSPFRGVQIAGVTNVAMGVKSGIQLSAVANVCSSYMRGIQVSGYNYADSLNGWQIGLVNSCISHPRGWQVGIINYSHDTKVHKLGLVNINPLTRVDVMTCMGTSSKLNMAVRFRNRSTYNIIGVGTHYMGFDKDFSGALFYRIGQYFTLAPKWSISGDIGYFHIETFQKNSKESPERLFSLQARLNVDYQLTRIIGAFASVGYGNTRYYNHARLYRHRMLAELGFTFRLVRSDKIKN